MPPPAPPDPATCQPDHRLVVRTDPGSPEKPIGVDKIVGGGKQNADELSVEPGDVVEWKHVGKKRFVIVFDQSSPTQTNLPPSKNGKVCAVVAEAAAAGSYKYWILVDGEEALDPVIIIRSAR